MAFILLFPRKMKNYKTLNELSKNALRRKFNAIPIRRITANIEINAGCSRNRIRNVETIVGAEDEAAVGVKVTIRALVEAAVGAPVLAAFIIITTTKKLAPKYRI
jgi:hypothetical protein